MARGAFRGNVFQVELSPGVRHVLGFLDCMLPSFLQKQKGLLGFWDSGGQFLPPCDFPGVSSLSGGRQHYSDRIIITYYPCRNTVPKRPQRGIAFPRPEMTCLNYETEEENVIRIENTYCFACYQRVENENIIPHPFAQIRRLFNSW